MSTISYMDEPRESRIEPPVSFEPTYQLGPEKPFPVSAVKGVLQDVMERHLENRQYEPEFCKETTKNMSEVFCYLYKVFLFVPALTSCMRAVHGICIYLQYVCICVTSF